jgi:drug/metabolite transporter (DMT)-like permease
VTVFALAFQNLAMRHVDASRVATFNNAGPILTIAWGAWLFGERLTPALVVGGLLTLGGILWTSRPPGTGRWAGLAQRRGRPSALKSWVAGATGFVFGTRVPGGRSGTG